MTPNKKRPLPGYYCRLSDDGSRVARLFLDADGKKLPSRLALKRRSLALDGTQVLWAARRAQPVIE